MQGGLEFVGLPIVVLSEFTYKLEHDWIKCNRGVDRPSLRSLCVWNSDPAVCGYAANRDDSSGYCTFISVSDVFAHYRMLTDGWFCILEYY